VEYRWAEERSDQFPDLAAELVRLPVDVIVTTTTAATLAAKHATSMIAIIFVGVAGPVELGFIASVAQPGGNITGVSATACAGFFLKELELLKEAVPGVGCVAVLRNRANPNQNPDNPDVVLFWSRIEEAAAQSLRRELQRLALAMPTSSKACSQPLWTRS
jgi:ABC-type uncharacterized transport system substrate-binding protein